MGFGCQEKNIQTIYVSAVLEPDDARLYPYTKGLYSTDDDLKLFTNRQFVYNTSKNKFLETVKLWTFMFASSKFLSVVTGYILFFIQLIRNLITLRKKVKSWTPRNPDVFD